MIETLFSERRAAARPSGSAGIDRLPWNRPAQMSDTLETVARSNLIETWGSYVLQIALPGVEPDSVEIEIVARQVTVRGRHHVPDIDGGTDVWRTLPVGQFEQVFRVPAAVDGDRADARFARGILTVRMSKVAHLKPKHLTIHLLD